MLPNLHTSWTAVTDTRPTAALYEVVTSSGAEWAVSVQPERAWRDFLESLKAPLGPFLPSHVAAVARLWRQLRTSVGLRLPLPLTQGTGRGTIQLSWDAGRYYLEIDVLPTGKLTWFYRDRITNELDGTDDDELIGGLTESLRSRLARVLS